MTTSLSSELSPFGENEVSQGHPLREPEERQGQAQRSSPPAYSGSPSNRVFPHGEEAILSFPPALSHQNSPLPESKIASEALGEGTNEGNSMGEQGDWSLFIHQRLNSFFIGAAWPHTYISLSKHVSKPHTHLSIQTCKQTTHTSSRLPLQPSRPVLSVCCLLVGLHSKLREFLIFPSTVLSIGISSIFQIISPTSVCTYSYVGIWWPVVSLYILSCKQQRGVFVHCPHSSEPLHSDLVCVSVCYWRMLSTVNCTTAINTT